METPPVIQDAGADRVVRVGEILLHIREWGDPAAPPAVVLHGIMGHSREWDVLTAALARQYRVVAVDQRGHGESEWAPDYTVAALAGDLMSLIDQLALAPARLIGHSLGGMAALLAAARRPDLVAGLVVIDVGPESLSSSWGRQELPGILAGFADASYADPQEAVAEWPSGDPLAREPLMRHYVTHGLTARPDGRLRWRFDGHGLARQAAAGLVTEAQLWSAVDRIDVPTLLVRGEFSPLLSADAADRMVRRLTHGRRVDVAGGAHDLGVEQPEAVADAAAAFLGGLARR